MSTGHPAVVGAGGTMGGAAGGSSSGTLTKRSSSRQAMMRPTLASADSLVKDYTKKRWMILALLSTEIETLVTTQYPLENSREGLIAVLGNLDCATALGKKMLGKNLYKNDFCNNSNFPRFSSLLRHGGEKRGKFKFWIKF